MTRGPAHRLDRLAGRVYTRALSLFAALVAIVMLAIAVAWWVASGLAGAWMWLLGAVFFGAVARAMWRSRAALSDIDFTP